MKRKELIKQQISTFQASLPVSVKMRQIELPTNSQKIITAPGVRRCGKSSLFMLSINKLLSEGVDKRQILFFNFDDERYHFNADNLDEILQAYQELYTDLSLKNTYIFFDEIQMADDWQPFIRRIYEQVCKNVFITGSNSKMLSSELATSLRGRTLQYEVYPLSFKEYCDFLEIDTNYYVMSNRAKLIEAFGKYMAFGGFPEVTLAKTIYKERILQEYFFVMLYKDLIERYEIKNPEPVRYFIKRIMANLTKPTSINKIYNELKSQGISIGKNTLYELIGQTESIYLFFPLTKFDPSLVKEASGDKKYYCIDNGLYRVLVDTLNEDTGKLLENLVYLHLRRNLSLSGSVHYYKGKKECDFLVVERQKVQYLIQVSYSIHDIPTLQRETEGLIEAATVTGCDSLYILTMDEEDEICLFGKTIKVMPVWKWMLG